MDALRTNSGSETSDAGLPYPRWVEVTVVVGFFFLYFLLRLVGVGAQDLSFGAVFYGSVFSVYAVLPFFLARVYWELRVGEIGWAGVIGGHLVLMFAVIVCSEVIVERWRAVLIQWFGLETSKSEPTTVAGVIRHLTFIEQIGNYTLILAACLARNFFVRYTNKQAQAHELEQSAQRLKTQLASARLDALRMQMNPHFLFNTLHVINTMAGSNPDGVRQATRRLSGLLRYALETADEQEVPVSRELQFLRGYLQIQKFRLQEDLQFEITVASEAREALVPTLLLQPLAENAVKHGVQAIEGTGQIRADVRREGRRLVLRIDDNGPGPTQSSSEENGRGLENIRDRLAHLYGDQGTLTLSTCDLGGCRAEVQIPYHTHHDPHFERVSEESASPSPA